MGERVVALFGEDYAHEACLKALVERVAREAGVGVRIDPRSVRGGSGRMASELREYLRDIEKGRENLPDLLIVGRDANCQGVAERRRPLQQTVDATGSLRSITVFAIPDPHIERWLLLDSSAFKLVIGRGCAAPDMKCDRHRYKATLLQAFREAGIEPPFGGVEYAEDLVNAMDLSRAEQADASLGAVIRDLRNRIKEWQRA